MEILQRVTPPLQPSVTINAFASSPIHLEEGVQMEVKSGYNPTFQCLQDLNQPRAQLECKLSEEAQKLDCKYNTWQIKMERRREWEWARMAQEGDSAFEEVFSMISLANSVK